MLSNFSNNLFWDIDIATINMEEHASFIVKRVLEYGTIDDWNYINSYYGISKILSLSMQLRDLEPRALSFLSVITKTPKEKFRCYILRQSSQQHWSY